jgi:hypothetical protein
MCTSSLNSAAANNCPAWAVEKCLMAELIIA